MGNNKEPAEKACDDLNARGVDPANVDVRYVQSVVDGKRKINLEVTEKGE